MKKKLILAATFLAVAAAVALPSQAFAADPYTGEVNTNTAAPGGDVQYNADTGEDGQTGAAELIGDLPGGSITPASVISASTNFTTSSSGHVTLNIKLPANATNGSTYTLSVSVGSFHDTQSIKAVVAPGSKALSFTGFDAMPYFWFGGGLVLLGAGLVVVLAIVRRNRKAPLGA